MTHNASIKLDDKEFPLSVLVGSEGEKAVDTRKLRADTGFICYDQGYGNTGSCESAITFLDGVGHGLASHIRAAEGQVAGNRRDDGDDDESDQPATHIFSFGFGRKPV